MGARASEFDRAGADLTAVGLGSQEYARSFRDEIGFGFPLLVDADRTAYEAAGLSSAGLFDLVKPSTFRARSEARRAGFRRRRLGEHPFQLGGSFVLASPTRVLFAHRSETFSDNAGVAEMLAAVRGSAVVDERHRRVE